eukprot:scaffold2663_cov256-Pinguiococcus_pyrenoidosus.AAC.11
MQDASGASVLLPVVERQAEVLLRGDGIRIDVERFLQHLQSGVVRIAEVIVGHVRQHLYRVGAHRQRVREERLLSAPDVASPEACAGEEQQRDHVERDGNPRCDPFTHTSNSFRCPTNQNMSVVVVIVVVVVVVVVFAVASLPDFPHDAKISRYTGASLADDSGERQRHQGRHGRDGHVQQALPQHDAHGEEDLRRRQPWDDGQAQEPQQAGVLPHEAAQDAKQHKGVGGGRQYQPHVAEARDVRNAVEAVVEALPHWKQHLVEVQGVHERVGQQPLLVVGGQRDVILQHRPRIQQVVPMHPHVNHDVKHDAHACHRDAEDAAPAPHLQHGHGPEAQRGQAAFPLQLPPRPLGESGAAQDTLIQHVQPEHGDAMLFAQRRRHRQKNGQDELHRQPRSGQLLLRGVWVHQEAQPGESGREEVRSAHDARDGLGGDGMRCEQQHCCRRREQVAAPLGPQQDTPQRRIEAMEDQVGRLEAWRPVLPVDLAVQAEAQHRERSRGEAGPSGRSRSDAHLDCSPVERARAGESFGDVSAKLKTLEPLLQDSGVLTTILAILAILEILEKVLDTYDACAVVPGEAAIQAVEAERHRQHERQEAQGANLSDSLGDLHCWLLSTSSSPRPLFCLFFPSLFQAVLNVLGMVEVLRQRSARILTRRGDSLSRVSISAEDSSRSPDGGLSALPRSFPPLALPLPQSASESRNDQGERAKLGKDAEEAQKRALGFEFSSLSGGAL